MPYKNPQSTAAKLSNKRRRVRFEEKLDSNTKLKETRRKKYLENRRKKYQTNEGKRSVKGWELKSKYGMTLEQLEKMILLQSSLCLVCKKPLNTQGGLKYDAPSIDHDHTCCSGQKTCGKCVRGILHKGCNAGLGIFNDDPVLLRMAAEYLERYKKNE